MTLGDLYTKRYFIEVRFTDRSNDYYYTAPTVEELEEEETTIGRCSPMEFDATLIETLEEAQQIAKIIREKPYVYAGHIMPHDANEREIDSDSLY